MSKDIILDKIKELRKLTGTGFKDCSVALKECNGDIDKSIEYLRIKGISRATKKMERTANEGLICITDLKKSSSILEINCETDFVAKNNDFINFCEELSKLNFNNKGNLENLKKAKMRDDLTVDENLIKLISKIGEKITISRCDFINYKESNNFCYVHNSIKKNIGKLGVIVSIKSKDNDKIILDFGKKLAMHVAATNPIAIDINDINVKIIEKEKKIIEEELKNSGKPKNIIDKISQGRLAKFKQENSLLNQFWILDPKKKIKEIINELKIDISIQNFVRYKIGN